MAVSSEMASALALKLGWTTVAVDSDVALEIQYVGESASATVTSAAANLTFKQGAAGAEAVDATIGAAGVIDTNAASYDTFGEVQDNINASANWRCRLVTVLRTDSSDAACLARSETTLNAGTDWKVDLYKDSSAALNIGVAYETGTLNVQPVRSRYAIVDANEMGTLAKVYQAKATTTYASGTSTFKIYKVVTDRYGVIQSETEIYSAASGATTVEGTLDFSDSGLGADTDLGYKLIVRVENSAAMTAAVFMAEGGAIKAIEA